MSRKNKNPYADGSAYAKAFDMLRSAGNKGVSRSEMIEAGHAVADVTVILSPRAEGASTRTYKGKPCDCRGNYSAQGHLYYVEKRKKDGEPARFVLRWRKNPLDKSVRPVKKDQKPQKTAAKSKAKTAKTKAKAKATAATA